MPFESATIGLVAGDTIGPARFVSGGGSPADFTVDEADANERTVGVSRRMTRAEVVANPDEHAVVGEPVSIVFPGGITVLELGGTVAAFDTLKSDAEGRGVVAASTGTTIQQIGAIALEGGAVGEFVPVLVVCYSERPALA